MKKSKLLILMLFTCLVSFGQITKQDTILLDDWTFDSDTTVTIDFSQFTWDWSLQVSYSGFTGTKNATVGVFGSNTQNEGFVLYDFNFTDTLTVAADTIIFDADGFNEKWLQLKCVQNSLTTGTIKAELTRFKKR